MPDIFPGLFKEIWTLLEEMAPYLLFGFLIAGILYVLIPREKVSKHLAHNKFSAVTKASVFGIPLPLCSCGVIPVAAHLEKQGANRGPILSFLISTPTTGVDSILATYSLMGPLLAVMRPVAALFNGLFTGIVANFAANHHGRVVTNIEPGSGDAQTASGGSSLAAKIKEIIKYSFDDLVKDVAKWLIIGILIGGAIGYFIPQQLIEQYLGNPLLAYPIMLLIGIPMYVCATGSIPIAASLILKGMSPGAGFIFLFTGPATNAATLSFVGGKMGKKYLAIYLVTILITGVLFGWLTDFIWNLSGQDINLISGHTEMLPLWLKRISAIFLLILMARPFLPDIKKSTKAVSGGGLVFKVANMDCEHCKKTIDSALRNIRGVKDVKIDLNVKLVEVTGSPSSAHIKSAIQNAGYTIVEREIKS
jgi:uncharacterized membrane protein YraQ (UPF0718 family)/copper chaperone CopZ